MPQSIRLAQTEVETVGQSTFKIRRIKVGWTPCKRRVTRNFHFVVLFGSYLTLKIQEHFFLLLFLHRVNFGSEFYTEHREIRMS